MNKKTILIVDDNADTRLILSARLKANHYHTVFAADALQAMSVAQKERPDAILLDLGLPGGNGLMVLQRLKANTALSAIPVIIVTAEDPQVAEARTSEAGAVAFLQKPVDQDKLMAAVQQVVGTT
jgi:twitching motility two-component system response regulator PilH